MHHVLFSAQRSEYYYHHSRGILPNPRDSCFVTGTWHIPLPPSALAQTYYPCLPAEHARGAPACQKCKPSRPRYRSSHPLHTAPIQSERRASEELQIKFSLSLALRIKRDRDMAGGRGCAVVVMVVGGRGRGTSQQTAALTQECKCDTKEVQ